MKVPNNPVITLSALFGAFLAGSIVTLKWRQGERITIPTDSDAFWHTLPLTILVLPVVACYLLASTDKTPRKVEGWIGVTASISMLSVAIHQ